MNNEEQFKAIEEWAKFVHEVLKEMRTELDNINVKLSVLMNEKRGKK